MAESLLATEIIHGVSANIPLSPSQVRRVEYVNGSQSMLPLRPQGISTAPISLHAKSSFAEPRPILASLKRAISFSGKI